MMGRNHMYSGLAVGVAAGVVLDLPAAPLAVGAIVCAGAAVLPDIDHPDATMAKTFGPVTGLLAWIVNRLSGGHRNGTHSGIGIAILSAATFAVFALHTRNPLMLLAGLSITATLAGSGLLAWIFTPATRGRGRTPKRAYKSAWGGPAAAAFMVAAALVFVVAALLWPTQVGMGGVAVLLVLTMAAAIRTLRIKGWVDDALPLPIAWWVLHEGIDVSALPYLIVAGAVVHVAGDMITKGGCPWGWPFSQANRGPQLIATNGIVERRVIVPILLTATVLLLAWESGIIAKALRTP
ncbi:metal-dependent hydrolase [Planobispora siamensis]|uniref:Uncharacterized protein n=1 Tax=Planobispora siamensis TaxID=936338 RepID=A0A8J3STE1_9ACTN|nr:metal-dependent hydrolase [Planobispora siamensis]GIH95278.1 hypothetical protein Psi01_59080 [Planobispora siamensis]